MKELNPMNELERQVVKMVKEGKPIHGFARDVLIDMTLREEENKRE